MGVLGKPLLHHGRHRSGWQWLALASVLVAEVVAVATVVVAGQPDGTETAARAVSAKPPSSWLTGLEEDASTSAPAESEPESEPEPEPEPEAEPRRFTVAASGDLLIHSPVYQQAAAYGHEVGEPYDFTPMFEQVAPAFEAADLSVCHLEVPLSSDNRNLSGFPRFSAPRQLASAIADAGFDTCSTASNHAVDQGAAGVTATLDALDRAGVAHAGTARSAEEADQPTLHVVDGVTVAQLSYTYGLNGLPRPEPWMVDGLDADRIAADAEAARDVGADVVVASLHWGTEYRRAPTAAQRHLAERLLGDADVDLILGHHPHVVQPVERINDRLAVYGLGNFLANQSTPVETQDGVIVLVTFEEVDDDTFEATGLSYVPTWVDRRDHTIVDVDAALDRDDLPGVSRRRLVRSWKRTRDAITAEGINEWGADVLSGPEFERDQREGDRAHDGHDHGPSGNDDPPPARPPPRR